MSGFWRKCRLTFRWLRYAGWVGVLLGLGAWLWLNRVGVPDFLKTRLVATLQERGVTLDFSRLRLHWSQGLVGENVSVGQTNAAASTVFSAREVQLKLRLWTLLRGSVQVDGLVLRQGQVGLALSPTNTLAVTNLQTKLRFTAPDTWSLDQLEADFSGTQIELSGEIRHATALANWPMFAGSKTADPGALFRLLKDFSDQLQRIHFEGQPQLRGLVDGDALDVASFQLRLKVQADGVATPWFTLRDFELAATVLAPTNAPPPADATWGWWTNAQPFELTWTTHAAALTAHGIRAKALECTGYWRAPELAVTRLAAQLGGGQLAVTSQLNVATRAVTFTTAAGFDPHLIAAALPEKIRAQLVQVTWATPPQWHLSGGLILPPWSGAAASWANDLAPTLHLQGDLACTNVTVAAVPLDVVRTHFTYANQVWRLPDLELAQGQTKLNLAVAVAPSAETYTAQVSGRVAVAAVTPWLPTNALARFSFPQPLALDVSVAGNLADRERLTVAGWLALTNFTVYGSTLDFVAGQFAYSNQVWRLAAGEVGQGATHFKLRGEHNEATKNFHVQLNGALAEASVYPFLKTPSARRGFSYTRFDEPVTLDLAVTGNRCDWTQLAATGHVAVTNASVREQKVDNVVADLSYTNLTLEFLQPRLRRAGGTQTAAGDKVVIDLANLRLYLVHCSGHIEPMVIFNAIGTNTAAVMAPFHFPEIPESYAHGCIPIRLENGELVTDDADIQFGIIGTIPLHWLKFKTTAITGTIHWLVDELILTNMVVECYGGEARGWAVFDLISDVGTDFRFLMHGTNVDFHRLAMGLWAPTNKLEGAVSGTVMITRANSADWQTWNGYGELRLQDGILWDVPIFGLISPMLNFVVPGLGNNRAKNAAGDFVMTNGVIRTDSLKIHTTAMQLEYDGTVDLQERVHARVTAQPLHTLPLVGPLVSTVLWPVSKVLECRVTGTLGQPQATPIYVPFSKLLVAPLHPIRSLTELFSPAATNARPR